MAHVELIAIFHTTFESNYEFDTLTSLHSSVQLLANKDPDHITIVCISGFAQH